MLEEEAKTQDTCHPAPTQTPTHAWIVLESIKQPQSLWHPWRRKETKRRQQLPYLCGPPPRARALSTPLGKISPRVRALTSDPSWALPALPAPTR